MPHITTSTDITLVTLQNCPSSLTMIHNIFDKAAQLDIDIDMISLAPSQSDMSTLSFTMSDHDLSKLLTFSSHLHNELAIKTVISSGNSKIMVTDESMKNNPGFACKIFGIAAKVNADIRMITTAETEISLLVPTADYETTISAIKAAFI